jgi:hypothetical protein
MAKQILKDVTVSVGGTALGTSVKSVEISLTADAKEISAFGDGWVQRIAGLKDGSVKIDFMQDWAGGSVESVLYPLLGQLATVVIVPNAGTVSATNPSYTAVCLVNQISPVAGAVGDVATQSVTWPTSGTVTKATS